METFESKKPKRRSDFIDGANCPIPVDQRKLAMPDGETRYYPLDMWPPIPGQECRPHILRCVGAEIEYIPTTAGYLGSFYPGGFNRPATQRLSDIDVKLTVPGYVPQPQIRPFADQLESFQNNRTD